MRAYSYTENGFTFERVNRKRARAAYNNGLRVILCPVNLRPGYPFYPEISISGKAPATFETQENAFIYYNCTTAQAGKYPAYYIPVKTVDRFTGESPTAETMGTVKQYDYNYMGGLKNGTI